MIVTVATGNAGKLRELAALIGPVLDLRPAPEGYQGADENGETYLANARLKARALARQIHGAALADDSGLEVDALGGRPGVLSARYAESAAAANRRLLDELGSLPGESRGARFRTVLVLVLADGREISAEGACEGRIAEEPRGAGGFGYDPVFLFPPLGRTFAELTAAEKNRCSARAAAARALREAIDRTLRPR